MGLGLDMKWAGVLRPFGPTVIYYGLDILIMAIKKSFTTFPIITRAIYVSL